MIKIQFKIIWKNRNLVEMIFIWKSVLPFKKFLVCLIEENCTIYSGKIRNSNTHENMLYHVSCDSLIILLFLIYYEDDKRNINSTNKIWHIFDLQRIR